MEQTEFPKDILHSFFFETHSVKHSPRFQIIVTHGVLELLVNALVEHYCKSGKKIIEDSRAYPHATKVLILHEKEIITDYQFMLLENFRKLRNKAAHGGHFSLTAQMLAPFKDMKIPYEKERIDKPEKLDLICQALVFGIWNYKVEIFSRYFEIGKIEKAPAV